MILKDFIMDSLVVNMILSAALFLFGLFLICKNINCGESNSTFIKFAIGLLTISLGATCFLKCITDINLLNDLNETEITDTETKAVEPLVTDTSITDIVNINGIEYIPIQTIVTSDEDTTVTSNESDKFHSGFVMINGKPYPINYYY